MQPNDFFIAGGTLRPQAPSYVKRPADDALLDHLLAGEFCYVLTPRQMGKSSLMVRTAARLRDQDIQTVIVDLTSIGSVSVDEWYLGLLSRIRTALRLDIDVQEWWQAQAVGTAQRFSSFLHDEVLGKSEGRIVIFIDEIDSTLNLDFRDDFFAAVRALYNARANEPIYQRITFAFLGVATPTELIQDRERTPFNIGQRIGLQEFTLEDARPLQEGLESLLPEMGETLLRRIFHWTSGHPYLTQKLCLAIASHAEDEWNESAVDQLVTQSFLSEEGRRDTNLAYVQDRVFSNRSSERRALLTLYRQVFNGKRLPDDDRSSVQNRLELYGLLKVQDGVLYLRNEIYHQVFNGEWITSNIPVNSRQRTAIGAVVIALLLVALSALYFVMQSPPGCDVFVTQFNNNPKTQTVRISALASLFSQGCDSDALKLFYELFRDGQKQIFLFENPQSVQANLRTVVEKLSRTLDWSAGDDHDQKLMEEMIAQLQLAGIPSSDSLVQMLQHWHDGRKMARSSNFAGAVVEYTAALQQVDDNPVLFYDRAMAFVELNNYFGTLRDLDETVRIANLAPTPTPTPLPSLTDLSYSSPLSPSLATTSAVSLSMTTTRNVSLPAPPVSGTSLQETVRNTPQSTENNVMAESELYPSRFLRTDEIIAEVKTVIQSREKLLNMVIANPALYPHLAGLFGLQSVAAGSWIDPIGGIQFLYVPAGEFQMGSSEQEIQKLEEQCGATSLDCSGAFAYERPTFRTSTPSYWIGQTEITNAQYQKFIDGGGYTNADYWDVGWQWRLDNSVTQPGCWNKDYLQGDNKPVVCVSWYEARAFTKWLAAKSGFAIRLPSEVEWEKAARGTQGNIYPWGNDFMDGYANYCDSKCPQNWREQGTDGYATTAPVGSFPLGASPYGAMDMAGNVSEWTSSAWGKMLGDGACQYDYGYPYTANDGRESPQAQNCRVIRGGSWLVASVAVHSAHRGAYSPDVNWIEHVGFRIVISIE